jgi:hypothetical protein
MRLHTTLFNYEQSELELFSRISNSSAGFLAPMYTEGKRNGK